MRLSSSEASPSRLFRNPESPQPKRWRLNGLRFPVALIATTIAVSPLTGCAGDEKLTNPNLKSIETGKGDQTFVMPVSRPQNLDGREIQLVVGVNMDCKESDNASTKVSVRGAIEGFETLACNSPQYNEIVLQPSDPIVNVESVTVDVDTSGDQKWTVGAEMREQ